MSNEADKYMFSGYQMPRIQLDSTGDGSIQIPRSMFPKENIYQPSYFRQPSYYSDDMMSSSERRRAVHGRLYGPVENNWWDK